MDDKDSKLNQSPPYEQQPSPQDQPPQPSPYVPQQPVQQAQQQAQYTQQQQYSNTYQQPGAAVTQTVIVRHESTGNGLGAAALVLGIIAIIGAWIPLLNIVSLILAFLALIFGICGIIVGIVKKRTKGTAIAGLVLSIISILIFGAIYSII